jgi:hypothetical protein
VTSKVLIANRALTKLGEARIISLDSTLKTAATIDSMYDTVLNSELRARRWHFAKRRAELPALSDRPEFGFRSQYLLPMDFLALIQLADLSIYPKASYEGVFSIEGRQILTNLSAPLRIRYIASITDPNFFDASFVEVFACRLALEACESITQSETKFNRVAKMYATALSDAIRANALERPAQAIGEDTWLESRR